MNYEEFIKPTPLVQRQQLEAFYNGSKPQYQHEPEEYHAREFEGSRNIGSFSMQTKSKIIAISIAVAALSSLGIITVVQEIGHRNATRVVDTIEVPNAIASNTQINVQNNGEAYFVDANGNKSKELNGINADDLAKSLSPESFIENENTKGL